MRKAPAILLLCLVAAVIYLPSAFVPFYSDDYPHFVENPRILHSSSLQDIFRNGTQETRPLFNVSMAAQAYLFGTNAEAAHIVNVLLFFASGVLFYLLIGRITSNAALSLLAAVLLLIHPMAVESVVYLNSRSGLLALVFSLAGWIALSSPGKGSFWIGILFLLLAIGSKEDAVAAVPIAYFIAAKTDASRWEWWKKCAVVAVLLVLPLLYISFRSPHVGTVGEVVEPWYEYLWHQGAYLPLHLGRFVWPWPLTLNWDLSPRWFSVPSLLVGWVLLSGLAWICWRKKNSLEAFGLAWMVLSLLPTHSVVPLLDVQATRISFPALPGFALFAAALLMRFVERSRRVAFVGGVLLLMFFSWRSVREIWVWTDPVAMWEENVSAAPSRWRGWVNLAVEYGERKRWSEAWNAISNAARLKPDEPMVLHNQAVVAALRTDGLADVQLARANLVRVLRIDPARQRARNLLRELDGQKAGSGKD